MIKIINYIEKYGFSVQGKYIYKHSQSTRSKKVVGQLNETNFYFYTDNVAPFKAGVNYIEKELKVSYNSYIEKVKENERNDFEVSFNDYLDTTKNSSVFSDFILNICNKKLSKDFINYYDIRGVKEGYLQDAVCFPFIDFNGNFLTAQIIKYENTGKRIKTAFSQNWYHSYKPIINKIAKENDAFKVNVRCFFGENYLPYSNNIIGIVEAPKTAVILKEVYPNIDWIATAGEQALFNKDLSILENRKVVIFPDAHTTKWTEFAEKKGWGVFDLLNIEGVKEGSDIADHIFDNDSPVFYDLHNKLFQINKGIFDTTFTDNLEFDFRIVGKSLSFFAPVPYSLNKKDILHKTDNYSESKILYKGAKFDIYEQKLVNGKFILDTWVLNGNVDFHAQDRKENGELQGFNETSFLYHLQKCYRILKELNPETYLDVFKFTLNALNDNSNFRFNKDFVLNRMIPVWDTIKRDLKDFRKYRNWRFKWQDTLTRKEFERSLNDDKFRAKLNVHLLAFKDVLEENRFIDIETDLGLSGEQKGRGYSKLFELVKEWNEKVIGVKTLKSYLRNVEIEFKTKSLHPHIETTYRGVKKMFKTELIKEIETLSGYKRREIVGWLNFKKDLNVRDTVRLEINGMIENINSMIIYRMNSKICNFVSKEVLSDMQKIQLHAKNWNDIFNNLDSLEQELKDVEMLTNENYAEAIKDEIKYLKYLENKNKERFNQYQSFLNSFKENILENENNNVLKFAV